MKPSGGAVAVLFAISCANSVPRGDNALVISTRDVSVADAAVGSNEGQGYEYVARRPLGVVALAEARGIDSAMARAAVERLADALDTCVTSEGRKGTLAAGAARVVAQIAPDGTVAQASIKTDPGDGTVQTAVVCLLAPVKLLVFPPMDAADAASRGLAIEALWGKLGP